MIRCAGASLALLIGSATIASVNAADQLTAAQRSDPWFKQGQETVAARLRKLRMRRETRAKNVILFVADGNGLTSNMATRFFAGQNRRPPFVRGAHDSPAHYGEEHVLPHEDMPNLALSKTYNTNAQTPDSAGTASALNTGVKTKSGVISVGERLRRGYCTDVKNATAETFAETVKRLYAKKVGVVTTARITHATPAAVYAHSADRNWEASSANIAKGQRETIEHYVNDPNLGCTEIQPDIARQLVNALLGRGGFKPNRTVDIALGGGREMFLPKTKTGDEHHAGARKDGKNLLRELQDAGALYTWSKSCDEVKDKSLPCKGLEATIKEATASNPPKAVLGLFEPSHMMYEFDRIRTVEDEPGLRDLTKAAIDYLEITSGSDGYYLMVEGGRVDHANHQGSIYRTVTDSMAYQEAVQYALDHTSAEDTLIISTADHSHGLEFQAYCGRGSPVNGICYDVDKDGEKHSTRPLVGDDRLPFTVMAFMNGAGSVLKKGSPNELIAGHRRNVTHAMATSPSYRQEALIPKGAESHSGTDVAIYARGPWAHLVDGTVGDCCSQNARPRHGEKPCNGSGVPKGKCNCAEDTTDVCGVCGGNAQLQDGTPVSAIGKCDCMGHVKDECGVCGGFGKDVCGKCNGEGIEAGKCDCEGHVQDCNGVCGGDAKVDACGTCGGSCKLQASSTPTFDKTPAQQGDGNNGGLALAFLLGLSVGIVLGVGGKVAFPLVAGAISGRKQERMLRVPEGSDAGTEMYDLDNAAVPRK